MERRAIDPSGQLLSPYDAHLDQTIPWQLLNVKAANQESSNSPTCQVIDGQGMTREHLLRHIGVEDELRLNLLLNHTEKQGIAQILNHPRNIDQLTRILYYRWTRKTCTIHPANKMEFSSTNFTLAKNATHVITAITLGIDLLIVVHLPSDIESIRMIDIALDAIKEQLLFDHGNQIIRNTDPTAALKKILHTHVYSNLDDLQGEQNIDRILTRINECKKTAHLCSSLKYTLQPIKKSSSAFSSNPCIFHPLGTMSCERIEDCLIPWRDALKTLDVIVHEHRQKSPSSHLGEKMKECRQVYVEEVTRISQLVTAMRKNFKTVRLIDSEMHHEKQRSEVNKILQLIDQSRPSMRPQTPSHRHEQHQRRPVSSHHLHQANTDRATKHNDQRRRGVSAGRDAAHKSGDISSTSQRHVIHNSDAHTHDATSNRASFQPRSKSSIGRSATRKTSLTIITQDKMRSTSDHFQRPYFPLRYATHPGPVDQYGTSSMSAYGPLPSLRPQSPTTTERRDVRPLSSTSKHSLDHISAYDHRRSRKPSPRSKANDLANGPLGEVPKPPGSQPMRAQHSSRTDSFTSLEGAPRLDRPSTQFSNPSSGYNDRVPLDVNSSDTTTRGQSHSPTQSPKGAKRRSRSSSPSRKEAPVPKQTVTTAASEIPAETTTSPPSDQVPTIIQDIPRKTSDEGDGRSLAQRADMKTLVANSLPSKSNPTRSPRPQSSVIAQTSTSKAPLLPPKPTLDDPQTNSTRPVVHLPKSTTPSNPDNDNTSSPKEQSSLAVPPVPPSESPQPNVSQPIQPPHQKMEKPEMIHILLLGQTGVGKSTFINALANYLTFSSLRQAESGEPQVIIPVSFIITSGFYFDEQNITFGPQDPTRNENFNDRGHSVTQQCRSYTFDLPQSNTQICIIDTPGFGDTRGIDQDQVNIKHITDYIRGLPQLDAICCLFKPNESKLSILFRTCFMQLFSVIGPKAYDKVMFCFTNSRSTFYAPGNTGPLVRKILATLSTEKKVEVKMEKKNTFCFDNEAFRYLVARLNGVEFKADEQEEYANSWKKSVQESQRLISTIRQVVTIQDVFDLIRPILETIRNSLRNLILSSKHPSSPSIEISLVRPEYISARCRKCPSHAEQIGAFWINVDKPHYIDERCISCDCPNKDHEQMKAALQYRLVEKASAPESMEIAMLGQLFSTARAMARFLQLHSSSSVGDPFLEGFRAMIEEERDLFRRKSTCEANGELCAQLERSMKKYADGEKREMVDGRQIHEMMETIKNFPGISKLLQSDENDKH